MNIELKNVKHFPSLSQETEAFTASLYIDGKHAGFAENTGHGGSTDYYGKDAKGKVLIKQAEDFAKSFKKPDDRFINMAFEEKINELLYDHLQKKEFEKFNRKLAKITAYGIAYGIPNHSYSYLTFNHSMEKFLSRKEGIEHIKNLIKEKIIPKLESDKMILNTNIPEELLLESGLKKGQYTKPMTSYKSQHGLATKIDQIKSGR
ncbi:hypothetical protein [Sphingobacterium siyangense]|uniref:Uncharacterized protein n=1 Tax=Sphingobacterium siyangense TaxID=459529 RepID=A0A562M6E5_9SPHI|nr:hypothetical protein [Sphingobacterium siyangense]TWI15515.1 hypothetical protein IQ31_05097 [Sphingobacterium siyangense]